MRKYILLGSIFIYLFCIKIRLAAQNNYSNEFDSLHYYTLQINKYKVKDTSLYNLYVKKIDDLTDRNDNKLLFYANSLLGDINKVDGFHDKALKYYYNALKYSVRAENQLEVAEIYDALVSIYLTRGEKEAMFEFSNKAISVKEKANDKKGIYKTQFLLLYYYTMTADYLEAFKIIYDAMNYYEESNDSTGIFESYYQMSKIYKALGNYKKAKENLQKCNLYIKNTEPGKKTSTLYNMSGTIQLKLGEYQDALHNFLKSLEIEKKIGNKSRILIRYNNIALTYSYLKNTGPAIEYFNICINEYKKSNRRRDLANVYNSVGMCYEEANLPDSSIKYYLKSIQLCEQFNFKEIHIKSALQISRIYDKIGKTELAHFYLKKYYDLFKIIDKTGLAWKTIAEEFEYQIQKEKKTYEAEKRNWFFLSIVITVILILGVIILWVQVIKQKIKIRKSQRTKCELEENQNELESEISLQNKELVSKILKLNDYNSKVESTIQKLRHLKTEMGMNAKKDIQQIINGLEYAINDNIWNEFEYRFMKVHPLLYKNLSKYYPTLTINERRLCALIYLNFSSKEIEHITKQSQRSILVAKSRLKNKLNIQKSMKIEDFLQKLIYS